ncbi:MAG: hypothetical protein LQ350_004792 [Teloschistes chrysophthalmus]|nr:MAG: hypothetical protein LQ350_004792 [Niorma chrysophthalma]
MRFPFFRRRRRHERTEAEQLVDGLSGIADQMAANGDLDELLDKLQHIADLRLAATMDRLQEAEERCRHEDLEELEEVWSEERSRAEIERWLREIQPSEKTWTEARRGSSRPQRRLGNGSERVTSFEDGESKLASEEARGTIEVGKRAGEGGQRNGVRFEGARGQGHQNGISGGRPSREVSSKH